MEKDWESIFQKLKKDISTYVELKIDLLKLNTYERAGRLITVLSYGIVMLFLLFFAILFVFTALGFFLGEWIGSLGTGFGIVALLYLALICIILLNRKQINNKILNAVIAVLMDNDEKNIPENNHGDTTTNSNGEASC